MDLFWTGRDSGRHFRIDSGATAGLGLVAVGIILTVLGFTTGQSWSIERFWPMLVVGFGVSRVVERSGRVEGMVLVIAGGLVQLSNFGLFVLPAREVVRYWPLLVVFAGIWELIFSRGARAIIEGSAIVFLGAWLQLSYFGARHISSYPLWPMVLAVVGSAMIWRSSSARKSP